MKKILLPIIIVGLLSFTDYNFSVIKNAEKIETVECKYGQCEAIAKSTEKRCKHCVSNEGDKYCWQNR